MSNASPFVDVGDGSRYTLTLAPDDALHAVRGKNSSGQGDLIAALQRTPLAAAVLSDGKPRKRQMDHVHLSQFNDTNFCQWYGRASDGYHYPIGKVMLIVCVSQASCKTESAKS